MRPFTKLVLAASLAAAFATPAMAGVSASATLSNFTVTLYDLNPLDNVAATLTWTNTYNNNDQYQSYSQAYAYDGVGGSSNNYQYGSLANGSSASASIATASASASVAGSSQANTPSGILSASGSAQATTASGWTYFGATSYGPYSSYAGFVLSANTAAVFQITANTQATTTIGYDSSNGQHENASASTALQVSGIGASGSGSQSSYDNSSSSASYTYTYSYDPQTGYTYTYLPQNSSKSVTLAGAFVNTSTGDLNGNLYLQVSASGGTNVAAVPEPESYAMFLAGLGIVAAVARRRQQKQA